MKRVLLSIIFFLVPLLAWGASTIPAEVKTSVVFIANYTDDGKFLGWGSGFFVDEGIVVTNKHVIEAGDWYRVYATGSDDKVDLQCRKDIQKSDVKINLDDDVAYMRVYLSCNHGKLLFGNDPVEGDLISVLGYPYKGSTSASLNLSVMSGTVVGTGSDDWLATDAHLDVGISGGPVVNGTDVLGVAVAKSTDDEGNYVVGFFIPSSVILKGLLYANDSRFGYTPQIASSRSSVPRSSSASSHSSLRSSSSSQAFRSSSSSRRSALASSWSAPTLFRFPDVPRTRTGYSAIHALRDLGIIAGYPDGTFRPDASINRSEFIKILVAGFRADEIGTDTRCFSDVRDEWFAPYVCAAKRLGWIDGYPDGTFQPAKYINRAEAMKILIGAFGAGIRSNSDTPSDVRRGTWFYAYIAKGVELGIIDPRTLFHPEHDLTREDAAIWINAARAE